MAHNVFSPVGCWKPTSEKGELEKPQPAGSFSVKLWAKGQSSTQDVIGRIELLIISAARECFAQSDAIRAQDFSPIINTFSTARTNHARARAVACPEAQALGERSARRQHLRQNVRGRILNQVPTRLIIALGRSFSPSSRGEISLEVLQTQPARLPRNSESSPENPPSRCSRAGEPSPQSRRKGSGRRRIHMADSSI